MKLLFLALLLSTITASAQYQKVDAPVDASGRTLSFHLYHFDANRHDTTFYSKASGIDRTLNRHSHLAGVSLGANEKKPTHVLEQKQGKLTIVKRAPNVSGQGIGPILVSQHTVLPKLDRQKHARRTFILFDGANHWALGYAPSLSQAQLAYALAHIGKTGSMRYASAYQLNAGNSSGFWVRNGSYHPFYLKEVNSPATVISVQRK